MSSDLSRPIHQGGRERGDEIFRFLLEVIRPPVLIAHGSSTRETLARTLGAELPPLPANSAGLAKKRIEGLDYIPIVYLLPSLGPPAFNKWKSWSAEYFKELSSDVATELAGLD